jgi:transcriptional regulator with XRE-family HTH domain
MPMLVEPHEVFAENLRRLRERRDLSQELLGQMAGGLHRTEISMLERGVREPQLSTVVRLAQALEVKVSLLLKGVDATTVRPRQRKRGGGPAPKRGRG